MNHTINKDKFGRDYILTAAKDTTGSGFHKGYVKIGNSEFQIEFSPNAKKEGASGWFKMTKMNPNGNRNASGSRGGGNYVWSGNGNNGRRGGL